jgi:hypothetical protein
VPNARRTAAAIDVLAAPDLVWPHLVEVRPERAAGHRTGVTVFDQPRALGWYVGQPDEPLAVWHFALEPIVAGTRIAARVELGPGFARAGGDPPARNSAAAAIGELRSMMLAALERVKQRAEARS